jgi:C4-dicarboxylate-specific signal transduction histidine kinase
MTRVFPNLFGNGLYATAKRQRDGATPEFQPTLQVATRDLGNAVEVRVRDNGTGIAPDPRGPGKTPLGHFDPFRRLS